MIEDSPIAPKIQASNLSPVNQAPERSWQWPDTNQRELRLRKEAPI